MIFVNILHIFIAIKSIEGMYVKIDNYKGVTMKYCGQRFVTKKVDIKMANQCFKSDVQNVTIDDILGDFDFQTEDSKPIESRAYGGYPVNTHESPWTVMVKYSDTFESKDNVICTGSIINAHWVITSADCNWGNNFTIIRVFAGDNEHRNQGQTVFSDVTQIHRHPGFFADRGWQYNIALIRLYSEIRMQRDGIYYRANGICLPEKGLKHIGNAGQERTTFFGWGAYIHGEHWWGDNLLLRDYLLRSEFVIQPFELCKNITDGNVLCVDHRLPPRQWMAPCMGDTGGGLVQYSSELRSKAVLIGVYGGGWKNRWKKFGTVSEFDCDLVSPKVDYFTPVAPFVDWITKTIRENSLLLELSLD